MKVTPSKPKNTSHLIPRQHLYSWTNELNHKRVKPPSSPNHQSCDERLSKQNFKKPAQLISTSRFLEQPCHFTEEWPTDLGSAHETIAQDMIMHLHFEICSEHATFYEPQDIHFNQKHDTSRDTHFQKHDFLLPSPSPKRSYDMSHEFHLLTIMSKEAMEKAREVLQEAGAVQKQADLAVKKAMAAYEHAIIAVQGNISKTGPERNNSNAPSSFLTLARELR
ncbi:hypothetical protein E2P81_ATG02643 [Venturia nashicola]|uniref:Uncharacterized protein n=1 Tax=Venturia nashicola TaxID=86259 RepID=A0A4Z1PG99_9PEZI|nr:hypothetical protein E6O75_ATG02706 [Venturia nashicola]TLD36861.1 hypothetical protein E2P81_ATG02643 [Venturia nashicola]